MLYNSDDYPVIQDSIEDQEDYSCFPNALHKSCKFCENVENCFDCSIYNNK